MAKLTLESYRENRNLQWNDFIDNKKAFLQPLCTNSIIFFLQFCQPNLINIAFYAVVFDIHCIWATHWFRNRISALWSNIVNFILDAICLLFASYMVECWKAADNLTRYVHNTATKVIYVYVCNINGMYLYIYMFKSHQFICEDWDIFDNKTWFFMYEHGDGVIVINVAIDNLIAPLSA